MKIIEKLTLFFIVLFATTSFSQIKQKTTNGYNITIATKNLQGEKILFYMLYGTSKKQIVVDSATIKSNDEKIIFKKETKIFDIIYYLKIASQNNEMALAVDNDAKINLALESKNIQELTCTTKNLNTDFLIISC